MGLLDDLRTGAAGVRLALPEGELLEDTANAAVVAEAENHVLVVATRSRWRLDLSPESEPWHLQAARRATRHLHIEKYEPGEDPFAEFRIMPWDEDPEWSPIIEVGRADIGGARAFRVLYRETMRPGAETIVGRILIPVEDGTIELAAMARSDYTGVRESVLYVKLGDGVTRAQLDSPEYDSTFADHVLSRLRRVVARLQEAEVTAPEAPPPPGVLELPQSRTRLRPPPGFALVPAGTVQTSPTLDLLTRVTYRSSGVPTLFDVFAMPGEAPEDLASLAARARASDHSWRSKMVRDIVVTVGEGRGRAGELDLPLQVDMSCDGEPCRLQQRWLTRGNRLLRLTRSVPVWEPEEEVARELDEVVASLQVA